MILICAMMTSIAIVREKEMGTMEILLVSPMKPIYTILSKITPYFVLSFVNFISIMLLSVFVLHVPIVGSLVSLVFVSLLYIFVSLSLGLLVSTLTNTQTAAMLVSGMALMIPVMLLSGMIFPIEGMPLPLQMFSNLIPAKWYIIAVKAIMIQGLGIESIVKEIGILVLMSTVLVAVSLKKFKVRLD
jgi:ABC-2 type transport system permease protein